MNAQEITNQIKKYLDEYKKQMSFWTDQMLISRENGNRIARLDAEDARDMYASKIVVLEKLLNDIQGGK